MIKQLLPLILSLASLFAFGQNHPKFPQEELNALGAKVLKSYPQKPILTNARPALQSPQSVTTVLNRMEEIKNQGLQKLMNPSVITNGDTIIVGATPNDTLRITGNWTHYGPILVLGTGVLIFDKATVVDTGDIYVFQNGKMFADSSSLTFPQAYFYQRSLIVVQNGFVQMQNCSLNYSGLSHNLVIGDSAKVYMSRIHQNDWTTCGLFNHPTLDLNGCNISGEYIMMDSCKATFNNADTLLLWHHFPMGANITFDFPNGDTVTNYVFNNGVAGVNGIKWDLSADSCHNVMWALMPENGTNVSISNSKLRAIGTWFRYGDTVSVSGLYDSSYYANFTAPLADRNLQMVNTDVQTWSLYVFDKSHIDVANCQVGEVGTQQRATVTQINPFLLDGTGGYYWCTDTSAVISFGAVVYSYTRSEKNGIFIFAYGWEPFSAPQAIGKSLMVYVQSYSPLDPVPYDAATVYMDKIDGPDTSYTNITVPVIGSAWIDWAGGGSGWMDFTKYSLFYRLQGNTNWTNIVKDSMVELHHAPVANWNTWALAPGNYDIKLTVYNTFGDSVEAVKPMTLLTGAVGVTKVEDKELSLFPNPTTGICTLNVQDFTDTEVELYNAVGEKISGSKLSGTHWRLDLSNYCNGIYLVRLVKNGKPFGSKRVIKN